MAFPTLEPFARRLESLRVERGLSQRALAERAQISTNHYQEIAHARANPSVLVLLSLADALDVELVDLFEQPSRPRHEYRAIFAVDLQDLAAAHRRLTDIIERITKHDARSRPRPAKPRSRR